MFLIILIIGLGMSGASILKAGWSPFWVHACHRFGDEMAFFFFSFSGTSVAKNEGPLPSPFSGCFGGRFGPPFNMVLAPEIANVNAQRMV